MKHILSLFLLVLLVSSAYAHLISDQGSNVITSNGTLLDFGNLTILIYTESNGGSLIFNTTVQNAIVNGSWNLMINPTLEYGVSYWKDYEINGEDLDFDGNERIEFQSPLGYINNFSFVNLSLINSCPAGSAIRLVYSNGSVDCQSSTGNGSADLTNYALKNQSETFGGNITTAQTGFFGFLGSLSSRISRLFVNEIDASGNINSTGNVTANYFKGDGSLLTNLPLGSESDPLWTANSSSVLYVANLPLANRTIVHCSNITGAVSNLCTVTSSGSVALFDQTLNTTANVTFESVNATREIYVSNTPVKQWLYNQTQSANDYSNSLNNSLSNWVSSFFAQVIDVFNRTEIVAQYYNKSDIISFNYLNGTNLQNYNDTNLINLVNQTLTSLKLDVSDQRYNETVLVFSVNTTANIMALNFYNKSEITSLISGVGNLSFNQTLTDALYYSVSNPNGLINNTQASVYNDSLLILGVNSSLWNYIIGNQNSWNSTFNLTYSILLGQQCPSGFVINGTLSNGTFTCTSSLSGATANIFNQNLNTTSNVTFANITINSNSVFGGNISVSTGFFGFLGSLTNRVGKIFAGDIEVSNNLSVAGNVSSGFYFGSLNLSKFPTTSCSGTDKVVGVNSSGGVVCGIDQTGSGGSLPVNRISLVSEALTDTNAPSTERIIGNSYYLSCANLTGYTNFRYGYSRAATAGATGAIVYIKYIAVPATTLVGTSYTNLSNSAFQDMIYTAANTANISQTYSMDSNLGDVCLGAFQRGGDGALDPQWRNIWVELS